MKNRITTSSLLTALLLVGCATSTPVAETPERLTSRVDGLISPTIGWEQEPANVRAERAWQLFLQGRLDQSERVWQELLTTEPDYAPALLGLSALAFNDANWERVEALVRRARSISRWTASEVYAAELALMQGNIEEANNLLAAVVRDPAAPVSVAGRYERVRRDYATQLVAQAAATEDARARVDLLTRAAELAPLNQQDQLILVETWLELGRPDDARATLEPMILRGSADEVELERLLAEIEVAERQFSAALRRYERLVARTNRSDLRERLERIKVLYHESTLPSQFHAAYTSPAITREDLAVLLFWKVPAVRFAQRLGQPPIAVDIEDVRGREELVRSLALGLLNVDPGTRRALPLQTVSASRFLEVAARVAALVAPSPCSTISLDRPVTRLQNCGVDTLGLELDPQRYVDGETAYEILDQLVKLSES